MKKTILYILPLLFIISSCYIYRPFSEDEEGQQGSTVSMMPQPDAAVSGQTRSKADAAKRDRNIAATATTQDGQTLSDGEVAEKRKQETQSFGTAVQSGSRAEAEKRKRAAERTRTDGEGLKAKIIAGNYYKITAEEREYKIQADQWEGDTLVSHILRKPKKVLKFHENQIDEELVKERVFSKPYSDVITVGSYAAGGAAILLLLL